jgi:hypothetical protein
VGTNGYTGDVPAESPTGIQLAGPPIPPSGLPSPYIDPSTPNGSEVLWSGETVNAPQDYDPFTALRDSFMASPSDDPIQLPTPADLLMNAEVLAYDILYDFTPFETGSFLYWGASTLYSIPSLIGGMLLHDVFGLPNEWLLANHGAEPLSGYTDGPQDILPNLAQGFQFLLHGADGDHGLLGYLDPSTYDDTTSADLAGALSAELAGGTDAGTLPSDLSDLWSSLF